MKIERAILIPFGLLLVGYVGYELCAASGWWPFFAFLPICWYAGVGVGARIAP